MAEIIGTVAERSVLTDAPLLAIRTGETADALVRCLVLAGFGANPATRNLKSGH
jgi:hypothetical protein